LSVKRKLRRWMFRLGGLLLLAGLLGWFVVPFAVSLPPGLLGKSVVSPVVLDRHGAVIAHFALPDSSRVTPVGLGEVPADFIACTLAAEDKRFYRHGGIDLLATLRAGRDFVTHRRVMSGASTVTQQLVKISSPPGKRSLATKIYEVFAARHLEMRWSKSEILTAYLNRLDYGNLRTGCAEAARFYFQKPLADLSLAECALLAGLPQAPSRLDPFRHLHGAMVRRNTVLRRLSGGHPDARITAALVEPVTLRPLSATQPAPWLAAQFSTSPPASPVQTTLDLPLQQDLQSIVHQETAKLRAANLRHAAVVVIDNPTGEILALVSSADWHDPRGGQLNGALVPRSPGSTLKPFTYLLGMQRNQRTPASMLADIPTPFRTPQGLDLPENYDRSYRGPVSLRTALACSLNVPALRELNFLGGAQPLYDLLGNLGISTLDPDPHLYGLGLTLGNAPVRLLELTNAYATLARLGYHQPARLFPAVPQIGQPLLETCSAFLIADILSDPIARAPSFQPGGPLDLPFRCAVKTGTSSDFHDNWCLGFTPRFTVGVWAGNFEQQPMKGISGLTGAGPIFHRAMVRLHQDTEPTWYERPAELVDVTVDSRTGKLVPSGAVNSRPDLVLTSHLPPAASPSDYAADGKARLDASYAGWFNTRYNSRSHEFALDPQKTSRERLRVISPAADTTFLLDPEIPSGSDKLRPVTNLPGIALWQSATLRIEPAVPEPIIHLTAGTHIVTAKDPSSGEIHTLTLRVKSL
jgi:penicillin-binding protein 1C